MATNKFKVYGQTPASTNLFPTEDTEQGSSDYEKLYKIGVEPDTLAKSQDVLTPLRELTIFSVSFFNWLCDSAQGLGNIEFKDAIVDPSDPNVTQQNLEDTLELIRGALTTAITNRINSKEDTITKPDSTASEGKLLRYVNNGSTKGWVWDDTTYQTASSVLSAIHTYFTTSANQGFIYKKNGVNEVKSANKSFVYFVSETQDANNNYILNLATFDYNE